jgi:hypothetical protein
VKIKFSFSFTTLKANLCLANRQQYQAPTQDCDEQTRDVVFRPEKKMNFEATPQQQCKTGEY